jgi:hypothetical protein
MKKELEIKDIDVKIKIAITYNEFRRRFPDLYEIISRDNPYAPK